MILSIVSTKCRQNRAAGSKQLEANANKIITSPPNERQLVELRKRHAQKRQHQQYQQPQPKPKLRPKSNPNQQDEQQHEQHRSRTLRNNNNDNNNEYRSSGGLDKVRRSYYDSGALHYTFSRVAAAKIKLKRQQTNSRDYHLNIWRNDQNINNNNNLGDGSSTLNEDQSNGASRLVGAYGDSIEYHWNQSVGVDSLRYAYNVAQEHPQLVTREINCSLDNDNKSSGTTTDVYNSKNNVTKTRLILSFDCSTKDLNKDGREAISFTAEGGAEGVSSIEVPLGSTYERRRSKRSLRSRPKISRRIFKKITPTKVIIGAQVGTWAYREYRQYLNGNKTEQQVGLNGTQMTNGSSSTIEANAISLNGTAINLKSSLNETLSASSNNSCSSISSGISGSGGFNVNSNNNTGSTLSNSNSTREERAEVELVNLEVTSGVANNDSSTKSLEQNHASTNSSLASSS